VEKDNKLMPSLFQKRGKTSATFRASEEDFFLGLAAKTVLKNHGLLGSRCGSALICKRK
jgi:hypothetical protein